jgi:hypothetical protein
MLMWNVYKCVGGLDPKSDGAREHILSAMKTAGLRWAAPKVSDGIYPYNRDGNTYKGEDLILPAIYEALAAAGLPKIGWQYIYGHDPKKEAEVAAEQIKKYDLDGFIIDAESEYKKASKANAASIYMKRLLSLAPNTPLALCSYRFPVFHPSLPWATFLGFMSAEHGDVHMPQMYWEGDISPTAPQLQLTRCMSELKKLKDLPVFPVGPLYGANGWYPSTVQIAQFSREAKADGCSGISWWSWDALVSTDAVRPGPGKRGWWQTLIDESGDWGVDTPAEEAEPTDAEKLQILWEEYQERRK